MTVADINSAVEAERAVLGAGLLSSKVIGALLTDGLRPEHFEREVHATLWRASMALVEQEQPVDSVTLPAEVERLGGVPSLTPKQVRKLVEVLPAHAPSVTGAKSYAERVMELALWRSRARAVYAMTEACQARSMERWAEANGLLESGVREARVESFTPERWATLVADYLQKPKEEGFIPLPFPGLTEPMGGGLQPGEIMLVAGWTGQGKSIFVDQMLDTAAKRGLRGHLYMTEMTAAQRGLRYVSRMTGIPYTKLRSRQLVDDQPKRVLEALQKLPYGCTIATGWDMDDVVRDALRARYDLVVIDLIHGFHYADERELDRLCKAAGRLARVSTTKVGHGGTAVVLVAHLNETQMSGQRSPQRPRPGMHSIKGASSLKQDSDFVCFVWQQDDDQGMPSGTGEVWLPKARSGGKAWVEVVFNAARLRFDLLGDYTGR